MTAAAISGSREAFGRSAARSKYHIDHHASLYTDPVKRVTSGHMWTLRRTKRLRMLQFYPDEALAHVAVL